MTVKLSIVYENNDIYKRNQPSIGIGDNDGAVAKYCEAIAIILLRYRDAARLPPDSVRLLIMLK